MKEKHASSLQRPPRWQCPFEECKCHKPGFRYEVHFRDHLEKCHRTFMEEDRQSLQQVYNDTPHVVGGPPQYGFSRPLGGDAYVDWTPLQIHSQRQHEAEFLTSDGQQTRRHSFDMDEAQHTPRAGEQGQARTRRRIAAQRRPVVVVYTRRQGHPDPTGTITDLFQDIRPSRMVYMDNARLEEARGPFWMSYSATPFWPWYPCPCPDCGVALNNIAAVVDHVWAHDANWRPNT